MKHVVFFAASAATLLQFTKSNVTALQTLGCKVHMICNQKDGRSSEAAYQAYAQKSPQVVWEHLDIKDSGYAFSNHRTAYHRLVELLQKIQPELIHCFGTVAGYYGRLAAKKLDIPAFYTAHDFRLYHGCYVTERLFYHCWEHKCRTHTRKFLAVCPEDADYAKKHLGIAETVLLPDVIDCAYYANPQKTAAALRQEIGVPEDAVLLVSVGKLQMQKRYRVVLQAMARLGTYKDLHYAICGDGEDRLFLENLVKQLHLEDRVHLLGYRMDIPDVLAAGDIFCMPARGESYGIAALEAIAAGLPLIVTRSHGLKAYIVPEENALCLKGNPVDACTQAIRRLYENKLLRRQIGAHNRAAAKQFQDTGRMMELRQLYQEVVCSE